MKHEGTMYVTYLRSDLTQCYSEARFFLKPQAELNQVPLNSDVYLSGAIPSIINLTSLDVSCPPSDVHWWTKS